MTSTRAKPQGMGIAFRIALWSWAVALVALLLFAAAIIPQEKRIFQQNLESKARGVAVSLRNVAAGAVVNEDFSTVVDHCKEMLNGDPSLAYLVITKNDGFCLINERSGWRVETKASPEWRPSERVPNSGIGIVPLFNRRVFHYAQPFDYSGIEWGWIHVGLSVESYDRSVAAVYQRTGVLAIGCILLSLAAAGFYAHRLVRPILSLRDVVQRVAGGDLAARAEIHRRDELGTLAGSVNVMTEALLRRDRILESVRFAAQQLLSTSDWHEVIASVLGKIGKAAQVSHGSLFQNEWDERANLLAVCRYEWTAPHVRPTQAEGAPSRCVYHERGLDSWVEALERGAILSSLMAEMPPSERALLEPRGIRSLILIPIHVDGVWWGFLGFDDCFQDRIWTQGEQDSLRAAADMLGSAIARQRTRDALVEAKETLEQRVKERTRELQEQMAAKDRAHAELAEAQQKLMETSRQAGMAEVATGVLHNVGNVLNSVNVSANILHESLSRSHAPDLTRVSALIQEHRTDIGAFFTADPKGQRVPDFIARLAAAMEAERHRLLGETDDLMKKVGHIKEIVAMQQSYAKVAGVIEDLPVITLLEDALRINEGAFLRDGIRVCREFEQAPVVRVDKHKVLQILVNLLRNAKYAMTTSETGDKVLTLGVGRDGGSHVKVTVRDNGVGIAPENLTRIFAHGFTTKKDGHGFGLHSGALAAREMGGSLQAFSDGPGTGAMFILELPLAPDRTPPTD
jgi:signal transduction histidine kinase